MTMEVTLKAFQLAILLAVAFGRFARYASAAGGGGFVRGCYFTTWSRHRQGYGKFTVNDVPKGLCTHVLAAFAKVDNFGNTLPYETEDLSLFNQLTSLKKGDPGLKVLLSYGGYNFGSGTFAEMAKSPAKRKAMFKSAIAFIRQHNFDGLDLDWEYPLGVARDHAILSEVDELRAAFDSEASNSRKPRLLLTGAVAAGRDNILQGYDIKSMARSYDYIFLMSYDLHGSWERTTGLHAQLLGNGFLTTEAAAKIWVDGGMPKKKVVIGIPTYSRGWTLQSSTNIGAPATGPSSVTATYSEGGGAAYWEICEMIKSGGKEYVDKESVGAYMVKGNQWHGYDNPEMVAIKMAWIKKEGYAGAFIWALDMDDFAGKKCGKGPYPILHAISSGLGGGSASEPEHKPKPMPMLRLAWKPSIKPTAPRWVPKPTVKPNGSTICSSNPNGYFRDPTDCTKFYHCAWGTPYLKSCPAGLFFDEIRHICNYMAEAPPGVC